MKKVVLAAVIASAAIFAGCELKAVDDVTSCDVKVDVLGLVSVHQCFESTNDDFVKSQCADARSKYSVLGGSARVGSGCSGSAAKVCDFRIDGTAVTSHLYDQNSAAKSCDDIRDSFDD